MLKFYHNPYIIVTYICVCEVNHACHMTDNLDYYFIQSMRLALTIILTRASGPNRHTFPLVWP